MNNIKHLGSYSATNKYCHGCNKKIDNIAGHLNIILKKGFVTIHASTCNKCFKNITTGPNPFGIYNTGYFGIWSPKMGIKNLNKNCKYYKEIMNLIKIYNKKIIKKNLFISV